MIIKKLDVVSVAKISGIIAAAIGLIAGFLFFVFGGLIGGLVGADQGGGGGLIAVGGGVLGLVLLPILYGIAGFIGGLLQAFIYNIAAGFVGGIRIETE